MLITDNSEVVEQKEHIESTLEACHFCGEKAIEIKNTWTASYWIECTYCGAQISDPEGKGEEGTIQDHISSMERAASQWNGPSQRNNPPS